jgi:hypothetical protein
MRYTSFRNRKKSQSLAFLPVSRRVQINFIFQFRQCTYAVFILQSYASNKLLRRVWRYQKSNPNQQINEVQTTRTNVRTTMQNNFTYLLNLLLWLPDDTFNDQSSIYDCDFLLFKLGNQHIAVKLLKWTTNQINPT